MSTIFISMEFSEYQFVFLIIDFRFIIFNHDFFLAQLRNEERVAFYKKALDTKHTVKSLTAESELGTRLLSEITQKFWHQRAELMSDEFFAAKVAVLTVLRILDIFTSIYHMKFYLTNFRKRIYM